MEDIKIVEMLFERIEKAISELSEKFGIFCFCIAENILESHEDSEECVNDTWLATWNAVPPARPLPLKPYVGKITRNLAFDKYAMRTAAKRNANATVLFGELGEIADESAGVEPEEGMITACINQFLSEQDSLNRVLFVRRYWYYDSLRVLSKRSGLSEKVIKARLARMRARLKERLAESGVTV